MAGEQYLKVAAAHIRRAVQEKQNEINNFRHQMDRIRADLQREIDELNRTITQKESIISRPELDTSERVMIMHNVQEHNAAIEAKRRDINNAHDRLRRDISNLEQEIRDLLGKAVEFEQKWGV